MPLELAHDLATLALYDIVIFADDSGSMIFEEGGDRINDLKLILGRVAEVATLFDEDGRPSLCFLLVLSNVAYVHACDAVLHSSFSLQCARCKLICNIMSCCMDAFDVVTQMPLCTVFWCDNFACGLYL